MKEPSSEPASSMDLLPKGRPVSLLPFTTTVAFLVVPLLLARHSRTAPSRG